MIQSDDGAYFGLTSGQFRSGPTAIRALVVKTE